MNKFYVLVGIVLVVGFGSCQGIKAFRAIPPIKSIDFASVHPAVKDSDPVGACQKKKACLITYLAPWCPACHSFVQNHFTNVSTVISQKDIGVLVVVGADKPEKTRAQAESLGAVATIDTGDEFRKRNKVTHFPFFIVTQNGRVTHHGRRANDWINEKMNE